MNPQETTPIYNLKAVVRETGLKPDTLRAWERRYGLPNPERTESGHRLYSQRDIEILKWLMERQHEGLSIGRAVDLWHQLEKEDQDPLWSTDFGIGSQGAEQYEAPELSVAGQASQLNDLRAAWIEACIKFDETTAEHILSQAFALFPVEIVCIQIIQAGLAAVGEGWQQGRITVQQEHFASALAMRRLEAMLSGTPAPNRSDRVLIGCPAEEEHTFIPLMLALLMRRKGINVLYLGANVPTRSLETTIASTKPKLVILTAQQLFTAANLLEMANVLQQAAIPLAYGGMVFRIMPEICKVIPGYYLGDQVDLSVQMIEQILLQPRPQAAVRQPSFHYLETSELFLHHQAEIESEIWRRFASKELSQRHLASANANLGRNIHAALTLGNMDYLGPDIEWIEALLVNHYQLPAAMLYQYLRIYLEAVTEVLGHRGELICQWFERLLTPTAAEKTILSVLD